MLWQAEVGGVGPGGGWPRWELVYVVGLSGLPSSVF